MRLTATMTQAILRDLKAIDASSCPSPGYGLQVFNDSDSPLSFPEVIGSSGLSRGTTRLGGLMQPVDLSKTHHNFSSRPGDAISMRTVTRSDSIEESLDS